MTDETVQGEKLAGMCCPVAALFAKGIAYSCPSDAGAKISSPRAEDLLIAHVAAHRSEQGRRVQNFRGPKTVSGVKEGRS